MQNQAIKQHDEDANQQQRKAPGAFLTISEVAEELGIQQHVLRFWETKFTQIKPMKRGGGRRYYRPEDVAMLKHIHSLLYTEGYTIKGVQKLLKGQTRNTIAAATNNVATEAAATAQHAASVVQYSPRQQAPAAETAQAADTPVQQAVEAVAVGTLSDDQKTSLQSMLEDLKSVRSMLSSSR